MIVCERCGGNCDPGEIVQGVCLECLEEQRMAVERSNSIKKMLVSTFHQMTLEEVMRGDSVLL